MKLRKAVPALIAALVAGGASWALAEEGPADPEVTEVPSSTTTVAVAPTTTTVVEPTTTTAPPEEPVEPGEEGDEEGGAGGGRGEHPENHGRYVSEAAHNHDHPGQNHGEFVSDVARSDAGRPEGSGNGNGNGGN